MSIASSYLSKISRDTPFIIYNNNLYYYTKLDHLDSIVRLYHTSQLHSHEVLKTKKNFLRNKIANTFIVKCL